MCTRKKERKKDDSNVVTSVASLSSLFKSICNLKTGIMRFRGVLKTIASF